MKHDCGACGGSGQCQNDHHNLVGAMVDLGTGGLGSDECPSCGGTASDIGNCSVCGGTGFQED